MNIPLLPFGYASFLIEEHQKYKMKDKASFRYYKGILEKNLLNTQLISLQIKF